MTFRGAVVLRPEPGNARTAARLEPLGISVQRRPLFVISALPWTPPDPGRFDALLLTSGNAVRHAGVGLQALRGLPVLAVGTATATVARAAGLTVILTGDSDAAAVIERARARGFARPLHLAGRDRVPAGIEAITVYASDPVPIDAAIARGWEAQIALLHSPRAARRFAALVDEHRVDRARIGVAALSAAVARDAGEGWAVRAVANRPDDAALVALAAGLIDPPRSAADKRT